MRRLWPARRIFGAALSALPLPAIAIDWTGGFVLTSIEHRDTRHSSLDPDGFLAISAGVRRAIAVVEGEQESFTYRLRAELASPETAASESVRSVHVQELNRVFRLSEAQTLSIGKRLYSLDQTFVGQPLGFFQKQTDFLDPADASSKAEGIPMVVYQWVDDRNSLTAIYAGASARNSVNDDRNSGQALLRFGREFPSASASVVLRKAAGESIGWGGTFSLTLGDQVSAYGSAFTTRGSSKPVPAAAVLSPAGMLYPDLSSAIGPFRAGSGRQFPRVALGFTLTPRELPKIQVELCYDSRGLSKSEYRQLLDSVHSYRSLAQSASSLAPLARANLAFEATALVPKGIRRTYLSLNADHSWRAWSATVGAYVGLEDGSGVYYSSVSYAISQLISASVNLTAFAGSADGERGLNPVRRFASVRLKYAF